MMAHLGFQPGRTKRKVIARQMAGFIVGDYDAELRLSELENSTCRKQDKLRMRKTSSCGLEISATRNVRRKVRNSSSLAVSPVSDEDSIGATTFENENNLVASPQIFEGNGKFVKAENDTDIITEIKKEEEENCDESEYIEKTCAQNVQGSIKDEVAESSFIESQVTTDYSSPSPQFNESTETCATNSVSTEYSPKCSVESGIDHQLVFPQEHSGSLPHQTPQECLLQEKDSIKYNYANCSNDGMQESLAICGMSPDVYGGLLQASNSYRSAWPEFQLRQDLASRYHQIPNTNNNNLNVGSTVVSFPHQYSMADRYYYPHLFANDTFTAPGMGQTIYDCQTVKGVYKNCRGIWAAQWTDERGQRHTKYFNPKFYPSESEARLEAYRFKVRITHEVGLRGGICKRRKNDWKTLAPYSHAPSKVLNPAGHRRFSGGSAIENCKKRSSAAVNKKISSKRAEYIFNNNNCLVVQQQPLTSCTPDSAANSDHYNQKPQQQQQHNFDSNFKRLSKFSDYNASSNQAEDSMGIIRNFNREYHRKLLFLASSSAATTGASPYIAAAGTPTLTSSASNFSASPSPLQQQDSLNPNTGIISSCFSTPYATSVNGTQRGNRDSCSNLVHVVLGRREAESSRGIDTAAPGGTGGIGGCGGCGSCGSCRVSNGNNNGMCHALVGDGMGFSFDFQPHNSSLESSNDRIQLTPNNGDRQILSPFEMYDKAVERSFRSNSNDSIVGSNCITAPAQNALVNDCDSNLNARHSGAPNCYSSETTIQHSSATTIVNTTSPCDRLSPQQNGHHHSVDLNQPHADAIDSQISSSYLCDTPAFASSCESRLPQPLQPRLVATSSYSNLNASQGQRPNAAWLPTTTNPIPPLIPSTSIPACAGSKEHNDKDDDDDESAKSDYDSSTSPSKLLYFPNNRKDYSQNGTHDHYDNDIASNCTLPCTADGTHGDKVEISSITPTPFQELFDSQMTSNHADIAAIQFFVNSSNRPHSYVGNDAYSHIRALSSAYDNSQSRSYTLLPAITSPTNCAVSAASSRNGTADIPTVKELLPNEDTTTQTATSRGLPFLSTDKVSLQQPTVQRSSFEYGKDEDNHTQGPILDTHGSSAQFINESSIGGHCSSSYYSNRQYGYDKYFPSLPVYNSEIVDHSGVINCEPGGHNQNANNGYELDGGEQSSVNGGDRDADCNWEGLSTCLADCTTNGPSNFWHGILKEETQNVGQGAEVRGNVVGFVSHDDDTHKCVREQLQQCLADASVCGNRLDEERNSLDVTAWESPNAACMIGCEFEEGKNVDEQQEGDEKSNACRNNRGISPGDVHNFSSLYLSADFKIDGENCKVDEDGRYYDDGVAATTAPVSRASSSCFSESCETKGIASEPLSEEKVTGVGDLPQELFYCSFVESISKDVEAQEQHPVALSNETATDICDRRWGGACDRHLLDDVKSVGFPHDPQKFNGISC